MVHSQLTASFIIKALDKGNVEPLSFRVHKFAIKQLDDTANVLCAFVSCKVNNEFKILFIRVLLESDFLVEDEFVIVRGRDFSCDGGII